MPKPKDPRKMSRSELERVVGDVQSILWFDGGRGRWDPNKVWSAEELDYVAETLHQHGLSPHKRRR